MINKKTAGKPALAKKPASAKKPAQKSKTPAKGTKGKSNNKKTPWGAIFWTVFFIVVAGLFFYNRDAIRRTLAESQRSNISTETVPPLPEVPPQVLSETPSPQPDVLAPQSSAANNAAEPETNKSPQSAEPAVAQQSPAAGQTIADAGPQTPAAQEIPAPQEKPVTAAPAQTSAAQTQTPAAPLNSQVQRERTMYFINIDSDGTLLRTKVNRNLPVTDSPLTDTLTALIAGPEPDEQRRGLISLIPDGTRIVSATVRGITAYINLNENFQFNTYGVEGYAGALRQIVWTATEFSNVKDVQILIEGRRIDYLGEGVWIGSPVSRDML
ncbi:MAG: GerMN domain-containing protein [Treponema sp.]|nr:GerMN domain-containing protein [Treponema sp.]